MANASCTDVGDAKAATIDMHRTLPPSKFSSLDSPLARARRRELAARAMDIVGHAHTPPACIDGILPAILFSGADVQLEGRHRA